jgi:hypothetical protein
MREACDFAAEVLQRGVQVVQVLALRALIRLGVRPLLDDLREREPKRLIGGFIGLESLGDLAERLRRQLRRRG